MKAGILQLIDWCDRSVPLNSVHESAVRRFPVCPSGHVMAADRHDLSYGGPHERAVVSVADGQRVVAGGGVKKGLLPGSVIGFDHGR